MHEPIGGGWCRVTGAGNAATCYWWHERSGKKQWTEPTAEQIRPALVARKHASPAKPRGLSDPRDRRSPRVERRLQDESPQSNAFSPRSAVRLQLPVLSPRSSTRRSDRILPDTPLKPRLKVGPVPRQKHTEQHRETEREKQRDREAAEHLRRKRLQRQRAAEISTYRAAFRIIDADGSGSVEPPEVIMALRKMGKKVDESRFWQIFRELDLNHSSTLEYHEFERVMDTLARKKGLIHSDREGDTERQRRAVDRAGPQPRCSSRSSLPGDSPKPQTERQREAERPREAEKGAEQLRREHAPQQPNNKTEPPPPGEAFMQYAASQSNSRLVFPVWSDAVHAVRSAVSHWNFCANSWTSKLLPRGTETMRRRLA